MKMWVSWLCVCVCARSRICVRTCTLLAFGPRGEYPACPILADTLLEFSSTPKIKCGVDQKGKRKNMAIMNSSEVSRNGSNILYLAISSVLPVLTDLEVLCRGFPWHLDFVNKILKTKIVLCFTKGC